MCEALNVYWSFRWKYKFKFKYNSLGKTKYRTGTRTLSSESFSWCTCTYCNHFFNYFARILYAFVAYNTQVENFTIVFTFE